ncbi:MAG: TRAP-type C4-dicarboxylate transport system substrate-binding protein [Paracoccaceae bacterium]|jgi:TRAP-type C4-dicarboxylate transport system substrate-binding protein
MNFKCTMMGLALASVASMASAETVLRYNDGGPNRGARAAAQLYFAEQVDALSGGDLKLEMHWGGALLKFKSALSGIGAGTADLGAVIAVYTPNELKAMTIGDLPGANSDPWVGMRAMYELMTTNAQMKEALAKQNVVYIGNFTTTAVQMECAPGHSIKTVADIKGKKMRASGVYAKVLGELGATMVNMTYDKVYQALDSGLIDCSAGYVYATKAYKLHEVADSMTLTNWGQVSGFGIVMNKDIFEELTEEQRNVLLEAGSLMTNQFAQAQIQDFDSTVAAMKSGEIGNKVEITEMATEERAKLFAAGEPFVAKWQTDMDAAGYDGADIYNQFQDLIAKYAAERDAKGYPWAR